MSRLIAVELRRVLARRLTHGFAILLAVNLAGAGVIVFVNSRAPSPQVPREVQVQSCIEGFTDDTPLEFRRSICEAQTGFEDPAARAFQLVRLGEVYQSMAILLAFLALLLGASFIGAEWEQRTITTALTWEPRRTRLLLAKIAAVAIVAAIATVVWLLLLGLALLPSAVWRGTTDGIDGAWATDTALLVLRIGLFAILAAATGASLATIGRRAFGAVALVFVYVGIIESFVRAVRPMWQPWLVQTNLAALVTGETQRFLVSRRPLPPQTLERTLEAAIVTLVVYVAWITVLAAADFRRRDVA